MIPTNKLRFVLREEPTFRNEFNCYTTRTVRILQQWWEYDHVADKDGEWRDVPVEKNHG
jgi:hypothetical protein